MILLIIMTMMKRKRVAGAEAEQVQCLKGRTERRLIPCPGTDLVPREIRILLLRRQIVQLIPGVVTSSVPRGSQGTVEPTAALARVGWMSAGANKNKQIDH